MTTVELMENLAEFLRVVIAEYSTQQKAGTVPIEVYPGYMPIKTSADETASCVYALVTAAEDRRDDDFSSATVEIGFSIYDDDTADGWRSLFNVMEHVRQAMLKQRTVAKRNRLALPLKLEIPEEQPFPQWQGRITATYSIGQPVEEEVNFDFGKYIQADICRP